jgi:hypothetical protein
MPISYNNKQIMNREFITPKCQKINHKIDNQTLLPKIICIELKKSKVINLKKRTKKENHS